MIIEESFDIWNERKKELNARDERRDLFFYEREVWWCSLGLNIGIETNGKHENYERPILILKKFNSAMIWVLPLTSKEKKNPYYIKITHDAGVSWVSLTQIKAISTKRLLRKVGMISIEEFLLIGKSITGYITIEPRSEAGFSEAEATNNSIVASVVNQSNDEIKKL
jgi:mRNA interferase MazF